MSVALVTEAIDSALERHDLDTARGLVTACEPSEHADEDTGLGVLICTACARLPLRAEREALAERVRADLARRGWSAADVATAMKGLL